jgi:hypothetical protein
LRRLRRYGAVDMMTAMVVMGWSARGRLNREDHATATRVAVYTTSKRVYRG